MAGAVLHAKEIQYCLRPGEKKPQLEYFILAREPLQCLRSH